MANVEYKVEKLSAKNYSTWKTVIKSHLMSKDLWEVVVESKNNTDELKVRNEMAKHLLYISMEPQQIAATGTCDSAHDLWIKIKENHEGAETNLQSTALAEFLGMKYRKNESLVSYAGRYELALGKLESTNHSVDEKTKLWVFSNSLPQHLKLTVHMFNLAKPTGKVGELISQLKIQHHMDANESNMESSAFHLQDKSRHDRYKSDKFHRSNQSTNPNYNNSTNQDNGQSNKRQITCNYCRKPGHLWRDCRKYKSDNERKKKFGQMNREKDQSQQQPDTHQANKKTGAFSVKSHEFSEGKNSWIIDSGASSHITSYRDLMQDYTEFVTPRSITLGDGKRVFAYGSGCIAFNSTRFSGVLENVLWAPDICENLFSVCKAMQLGCTVEFKRNRALFYRNHELVLVGERRANSAYFLIPIEPVLESSSTDCALVGASLDEWHERLAHCSVETVKLMIKNGAADGLVVSNNNNQNECRPCIMGKLCRTHHPDRNKVLASKTSAILHIDTVGPFKTPSLGGARYFVLATEEFSGFKFIDFDGTKASIPDTIKWFVNSCELKSKRHVKAIVTDCGSEYTRHDSEAWLGKRGIIHYFSVPYTPQQNGTAERANRTVLEGVRTLLSDSGLPEELWAEAARTVVYTTNRLIRKKQPDKTRYELLTGRKPNLSNLRKFGQKAIIRIPDSIRSSKLAERGEEVTFVGYTSRHNTYRFYTDEPYQQVFEACDVRFISKTEHRSKSTDDSENLVVLSGPNLPIHEQTDKSTESTESYNTAASDTATIVNASDSSTDDNEAETQQQQFERPATRQYTRSLLQNNNANTNSEHGPAIVGVRDEAMLALDGIIKTTCESAMFILDEDEPRTIKEAQESKHWLEWKQAMEDEIASLNKNETYDLVECPPGVKPIKNKWVFRIKYTPDGQVERYKARLVAKGFTQIPGIDYRETYAPVASMNTIRVFLAICNQRRMKLSQFDIKTAFLYGELEEELFMEQPEAFSTGDNKVCRLNKSIYGLKQAPRMFNKKFDGFLKLFDLKQASFDKCLYFNADKTLLLTIYVDDGLVAGTDPKQLEKLINHLKMNFELKVSNCNSFLGIKIIRDEANQTLGIVQDIYIDKMLEKFGMQDCKPVETPEQVGARFDDSEPLPSDNRFKELVGSLLYISTCTRPDISHAVSVASRTSQPTQSHWVALKRILRYLKGTKNLGISFRWEAENNEITGNEDHNDCKLVVFSDADFANDETSRKSTTGIVIFYHGAPIAWLSQLQPIITLSTTEAEYVAGCEAVKKTIPIRNQLIELGEIDDKKPTTVFIDNQSTVRISSNEGSQSRTKHIDIREKWLTEQAEKKTICVKHISGDKQAADIMTKPLYKTKFITNRSWLLTKIIASLAVLSLCQNSTDARVFKTADPLTTVQSDYVYIKGDTRFRMTNTFLNPCEVLFNYSASVPLSVSLTNNCIGHFEKKLLSTLPNCNKLPTIGPELRTTQINECAGDRYNLTDAEETGENHIGKCEMKTTRQSGIITAAPPINLNPIEDAWTRHKKRVMNVPIIYRERRFIPFIAAGGALLFSVISVGGTYRAVKIGQSNTESINMLINITNEHTAILRESHLFLEQYRDHVMAVTSWGKEIQDLLGFDNSDPRFTRDPVFRGKKASLVKAYVEWFDSQSKLLQDINAAAKMKKISPSVKTMVNLTTDFERASNWSNLLECNYQIVNKSLKVDLDFILPTIDENIEILNIIPMSYYNSRSSFNDRNETCWSEYVGPDRIMRNKTNNCITGLREDRVYLRAVRSQTCMGANENPNPSDNPDFWKENCTEEITRDPDRVQIQDIGGIHKVYCYPFDIEVDGEAQPCPDKPFVVEGYRTYRIGDIVHEGAFEDTTVHRQIASTRQKRSAIGPTQQVPSVAPATATNVTHKPRIDIVGTLTNITAKMNMTIDNIKTSLKKIPTLNMTNIEIEDIFTKPIEFVFDGVGTAFNYIKSLGSMVSWLGLLMIIALIMPILELVFIGIRLAKIPVNLWIGSARRVGGKLAEVTKQRPTLSNPFKTKRKRWDDKVI